MQSYDVNPLRLRQLSIPAEELVSNLQDMTWLKENSIKVTMEFKDVLDGFNYRNREIPIYSRISPEYMHAYNNFRYRFIVAEHEGDYILLYLKLADRNPRDKFFYIYSDPVSYNENPSNVYSLVSKMNSTGNSAMRYIVYHDDHRVGDYKENNYFNRAENFQEMKRSKWRAHHGINVLSRFLSYTDHIEGEEFNTILSDMGKLKDFWGSMKEGKKEKVWAPKADFKYLKDLYPNSDSVIPIMVSLRGKMVGFAVLYAFCDDMLVMSCKTAAVLEEPDQREYLGEELYGEYAGNLQKYLGSYMQYVLHEYCFERRGFKRLIYDSDSGDKRLAYYKQKYYKNMVYQNRVSLGEYLELKGREANG